VERVQDLGRTLERGAEIFVSLIARDLRLVHTQTSRELALGDALRNARGNEEVTKASKVIELLEFSTLQSLVGLDLLYASKKPLAAEEIADVLGIARSNVSNSLRELQSWNIIRSVPILGDRRTFYTAETDLWNLVSRIAAGRKARELDPAAAALRECVEMTREDRDVDPVVQLRLREMLDFVERLSRWYDQMIALPRSKITTLIKLGGGIARLLDRSSKRGRDPS
jgi:DNA-binding transcriptional regulator GbsR (MarR family)